MAPFTSLTNKIKVHLKLSISRLRILQQKDEAISKQQRRAMAQLLEQFKFESARIRVESIIRSDLLTELYEVLELYCELLIARSGLLEGATPDPGLEEAIKSLLFAAPRTEVKELQTVRQLLAEKYGKEYALRAQEDWSGEFGVPERVRRKLRVEPPSQELVESYLRAIASAYDVRYGDDDEEEEQEQEDGDDDDEGDGGTGEAVALPDAASATPGTGNTSTSTGSGSGSGGGGGGALEPALTTTPQKAKPNRRTSTAADDNATPTPPRSLSGRSPLSIAPPSPSTESPNPQVKLPGAPELKPGPKVGGKKTAAASKPAVNGTAKASAASKSGGAASNSNDGSGGGGGGAAAATNTARSANTGNKPEGEVPDADDLIKRFAMLKR